MSDSLSKRTELMRQIRDEVWNFKESPLYEERIRNRVYPVIGEGSHCADIMFVGEAPGRNEAATGRPFCGAAGKVLDELLEFIGIARKEVYITNVLKDRPPMNRDPLPYEIAAYASFLDRQIDIVQPKLIATLGRFSMRYIMEKFGLEEQIQSISQIHGKVFDADCAYGKVKIVPLYHPAVAIYRPEMKEVLKKDFKLIGEQLKLSKKI